MSNITQEQVVQWLALLTLNILLLTSIVLQYVMEEMGEDLYTISETHNAEVVEKNGKTPTRGRMD